jgi:Raf kinase inhibitor-like YbhB/YbcL family protein
VKRRDFLWLGARLGSLLGLSALAAACSSSNSEIEGSSATAIQLESPAFAANGLIPAQYTCDGENVSPPLRWNTPPAATKSFALISDDPDAPRGTFVHWVLYNLPPDARALLEGVPTEAILANGAIQGKSDFGKIGYGGPCPPGGTHRYFFKLYALDRQLSLEPGATKDQLLAAMDGYVVAMGELIGRYSRKR